MLFLPPTASEASAAAHLHPLDDGNSRICRRHFEQEKRQKPSHQASVVVTFT
jgi:hypothetical protein